MVELGRMSAIATGSQLGIKLPRKTRYLALEWTGVSYPRAKVHQQLQNVSSVFHSIPHLLQELFSGRLSVFERSNCCGLIRADDISILKDCGIYREDDPRRPLGLSAALKSKDYSTQSRWYAADGSIGGLLVRFDDRRLASK